VPKYGWFGYRPSLSGELQINFKKNEIDPNNNAFKKDELTSLRWFSLDNILRVNDYGRYPVKTFYRINTSKVDEYCVIRNWIQELIEGKVQSPLTWLSNDLLNNTCGFKDLRLSMCFSTSEKIDHSSICLNHYFVNLCV
jgi:hypothetical protein